MHPTRPIVGLLLLAIAASIQAARVGSPRLVGPLGPPAASELGALLPFGDGQVAFSLWHERNDPSRQDIVTTPIDSLGIVQYEQARTIAYGAQSVPLAAQTSTGYLVCWVSSGKVALEWSSQWRLCQEIEQCSSPAIWSL
jgi:hypothetical protein